MTSKVILAQTTLDFTKLKGLMLLPATLPLTRAALHLNPGYLRGFLKGTKDWLEIFTDTEIELRVPGAHLLYRA